MDDLGSLPKEYDKKPNRKSKQKNMRKKGSLILMILSNCLIAQNKYSISDCIDYALKYNLSKKVYENQIEIAKEKKNQAMAAYLPQINGVVNAVDNIRLQTTILPAGIVSANEKEIQLGSKYNINSFIDINQTLFDYTKILGIKANKKSIEINEIQKEQQIEEIVYNVGVCFFQVMICKELQKSLKSR